VANIQQQLEQERQERIRLQQSIQQKEQAAIHQQQQVRLLQVAGNDAKYPNLADQPPTVVMASVRALANDLLARGMSRERVASYTDEEVCEFLETQLSTHKKSRAAKKTGGKPAVEPKPLGKPVGKTLTNSLGTAKYQMPAEYESLSDTEQMEHLTKFAEKSLFKRE
jgi:hypothetical protein